jgi:hypothetical protein
MLLHLSLGGYSERGTLLPQRTSYHICVYVHAAQVTDLLMGNVLLSHPDHTFQLSMKNNIFLRELPLIAARLAPSLYGA